jgi:Flp pilus assembly protein protease CpaA
VTAPLAPLDLLLAGLLVTACVTDLRSRRIPNVLTLPVLFGGILLAPLRMAAWEGLAGAFAALVVAFPGWRFGGAMRAGDVKLLMAAGALLGLQGSLRATVFTYVLALPFGLLVLAVRGRLSNLWNVWVRGERQELTLVAFAPVIAVAVLLARLQPWPVLW